MNDSVLKSVAMECFRQAALEHIQPPTNPKVFNIKTWNNLNSESLSLLIQSNFLGLLYAKTIKNKTIQSLSLNDCKKIISTTISECNLPETKYTNLNIIFQNTNTEQVQEDHESTNIEQIYKNLLSSRPHDLNTIMWFLLQTTDPDAVKLNDWAFPNTRLKYIALTVSELFKNLPTISKSFTNEIVDIENKEANVSYTGPCQQDVISFLMGLSVACLSRYASSLVANTSEEYNKPNNCMHWPTLPLCLVNARLLPSAAQRRCWTELLAFSNQNQNIKPSLIKFTEQLRFSSPTKTSCRLVIRIAHAFSCLYTLLVGAENCQKSSPDDVGLWAANLWEIGLARIQTHKSSVFSPDFRNTGHREEDENILFPLELVADWWQGTSQEMNHDTSSLDTFWFLSGWCKLSVWLRDQINSTTEPENLAKRIYRHVYLLKNERCSDPSCSLLTGKLVNTLRFSAQIKSISSVVNMPSLESTTERILTSGLNALAQSSTDENDLLLSNAICAEIEQLKVPCANKEKISTYQMPILLQSHLSKTPTQLDENEVSKMRSSYNSKTWLTNSFINNSASTKNLPVRNSEGGRVSSELDPCVNTRNTDAPLQTGMILHMVDQWLPTVTDFSRQLAETTGELSRSRLQNDQLSRLVQDTQAQLDNLKSEIKQYKIESKQESKPSISNDWEPIKESLKELSSSLAEFRLSLPDVLEKSVQKCLGSWFNCSFSNAISTSKMANQIDSANISAMPTINLQASANAWLPNSSGILSQIDSTTLDSQQRAAHIALTIAALQQQQQQLNISNPIIPFQTNFQAGRSELRTTAPPDALFNQFPSLNPGKTSPPSFQNPSRQTNSLKEITPSALPLSKPTPSIFMNSSFTSTQTKEKFKPETSLFGNSVLFPLIQTSYQSPLKQEIMEKPCQKSDKTVLSSFSFGPPSNSTKPTPLDPKFSASPDKFTLSNQLSANLSQKNESANQLTSTSELDVPEAYVPSIDFKPILEQLPDLITAETGEEGEERLFNEHAQLYRFSKPDKEWKARGTGDIRILADKSNMKFRVVMRRDQIKKLCANHAIVQSLTIHKHKQNPCMRIWTANDFSNMDTETPSYEGAVEIFNIKFKTEEIATEFENVMTNCVNKLNAKTSTSNTVLTKQTTEKKEVSGLTKSLLSSPLKGSFTVCDLNNVPNNDNGVACNSVKPDSGNGKLKFDLKSSKQNTWDCETCDLQVDNKLNICPACQTVRNNSVATNPMSPKTTISQSSDSTTKTSTPATSFRFGAPSAKPNESKSIFSFGIKESTPVSTFTNKTDSSDPRGGPFASLNLSKNVPISTQFTFNLKPPTSPIALPTSQTVNNADLDDDTYVSEQSSIEFTPVLAVLPDKIVVKTGEEDEETIFSARAKLYRFDSLGSTSAWKERGLGQLKILCSPTTNQMRIVMRRDQILKVCCNHMITGEMALKPLTIPKQSATDTAHGTLSWVWWAMDYSETDESDPNAVENIGRKETFSARFKTIEDSNAFHTAFMNAVKCANKKIHISNVSSKLASENAPDIEEIDSDESDLVIINTYPVSETQIDRARALQLPDEFYAFETTNNRINKESISVEEEALEDALLETAVKSGKEKPVKISSDALKKDTITTVSKPSLFSDLTPKSFNIKPLISDSTTSESSSKTSLIINPEPGDGTYVPTIKTSFDFANLREKLDNSLQSNWLTTEKKDNRVWANSGTPLFASEKVNEPSVDEDHDPHYEPIVPLPNLIEHKTGEEGEICLFIRRCRLYKMTDKVWKERGIGDMKIMVKSNKDVPTMNNRTELPLDSDIGGISYARLLMRRDQVLKICVNHTILATLPAFKPLTTVAFGLCWIAEDYSEGTGEIMTLGLKFKTEKDLSDFNAAILRARQLLALN